MTAIGSRRLKPSGNESIQILRISGLELNMLANGDGGGVGVERSMEVYVCVIEIGLGLRERLVRDSHRSFRTAIAIMYLLLRYCHVCPCGRTRNFDDTKITEEEEHNDIHSQPVPDPVFSENPHPGLKRRDSLDIEAAKFRGDDHNATESWRVILKLAFQSLGVVYGDVGTSPLYVFSSTFPNGIKHEDDILGVLSIIFYTITLITVIKYVMIVLRANDNGDGGTFALYSKLCRYAKVGLIPTEQAEDREVSNFQLELPNKTNKIASTIKKNMESRKFVKFSLLFTAMLGTSMVIGDGILTPSISGVCFYLFSIYI
ncbi:hypothetical protein L2E82_48985 [Cichorium intybus]|uniref:Uncharacterized protein n=1 Tax=Cichorium intybus TaxID=13427 RepID=A0ACB8YZJ3_CICIN|nr:hypothetical protein L2E82_48985 [Cichorium intybus]